MNDEMKEPDEEKALSESTNGSQISKPSSFLMVLATPPPLKFRHQTKMTAHAKMKKTTHF